jgi:hypothetical protein
MASKSAAPLRHTQPWPPFLVPIKLRSRSTLSQLPLGKDHYSVVRIGECGLRRDCREDGVPEPRSDTLTSDCQDQAR